VREAGSIPQADPAAPGRAPPQHTFGGHPDPVEVAGELLGDVGLAAGGQADHHDQRRGVGHVGSPGCGEANPGSRQQHGGAGGQPGGPPEDGQTTAGLAAWALLLIDHSANEADEHQCSCCAQCASGTATGRAGAAQGVRKIRKVGF